MSDPFKIEGPAQIGVSGGRTSGYMLHRILAACGGKLPADVHLTFQNTGKEMEETLVFIDEMSKRWGVAITWMEYDRVYGDLERPRYKIVDFKTASRNSEPFEKFLAYYDAYRKTEKAEPPILPNVANRMCSDRMKIKATEWYMNKVLDFAEWDSVLGIRYDEKRRYLRQKRANDKGGRRWESLMPLYLAGVTKEDVNAFWKTQPFDLGIDSDFGNCDACFLKHDDKLIRIFQAEPQRAVWWINNEKRTGQVFRKDKPSYHQVAWDAAQLIKHPNLDITDSLEVLDEEDAIDCMCGD